MKDYVKKDAELEAKASMTQEALSKHRWHWTLDESNPDRVSLRQYAKDVGRSFPTINAQAKGYETWLGDRSRPISDHIALANMGVERQAATEAVAKATGKSVSTMKAGQNRAEVTEVLATARDRAERNKTTVEEEVVTVAEQRAKSKKADENLTKKRKERHSLRYVEIEGHLAGAKKKLTEALRDSENVDFSEEEMELLREAIRIIKGLLAFIDVRFGGASGNDWDTELAALTKE